MNPERKERKERITDKKKRDNTNKQNPVHWHLNVTNIERKKRKKNKKS